MCAFKYSSSGLFLASWRRFSLLASLKLLFYCISLGCGSEPSFLSLLWSGVSLVRALLAVCRGFLWSRKGELPQEFSECAFFSLTSHGNPR